jgi:hypothetical protein
LGCFFFWSSFVTCALVVVVVASTGGGHEREPQDESKEFEAPALSSHLEDLLRWSW